MGDIERVQRKHCLVCFVLKVYIENVFWCYFNVKSVFKKYSKKNMPLKKHDQNQIARLFFFLKRV